jgi:hypothetical protein
VTKIRIDFRFTDLEHEVWSIGKYREVLEEQLTLAKEQALQRAHDTESLENISENDRGLAIARAYVLGEEVLPRFYRGPFLISLWAVFELAITEVAEYLAEKKGASLKLCDIKGRDQRDQWTKYYSYVAEYPLKFEEITWQRIEELRQIRNVLAHSNGRLDRLGDKARNKIEQWCAEDRGLLSHYDLLHISAEYVREAELLVSATLTSLVRRVKEDFKE